VHLGSTIVIRSITGIAAALDNFRQAILRHFSDLEWLEGLELRYVALKFVNVFVVTSQVATLSKCLLTYVALEWTHIRVFAEMVPQVAALAEQGIAVGELAAEVELDSFGLLVPHLDNFMPLRGHTFKLLNEIGGVSFL